ncbi:MAG: 5-(carboxyamino)imidazole ribonucleotide synthase [Proteobacteria bacterium]|nr:5-(carboxyamino)imidazole ribonucleotide synthase [Pseudomonadota bacterium]
MTSACQAAQAAAHAEPEQHPLRAHHAPRLGIIGAGQLARMTAIAAAQLGCEVVVLAAHEDEPACALATRCVFGDRDDAAKLAQLAAQVDVVTLENEFVDARSLAALERQGVPLFPSAACVRAVQDKFVQKSVLTAHGVATPAFRAVASVEHVVDAAAELGWPLVLKARRNGYDGKGNATLHGAADVSAAWHRLGGAGGELYVEQWCPFVAEVAVIVTRARDGASVVYPVTETVQRNHVCHRVMVPAALPSAQEAAALELAARAVAAVGGVGSFGVELFVMADGRLLLNELAPRVHNSGHYTIEACACSQFENHVRAVFGWPLGSTALRASAAVMVNLLGTHAGAGRPLGLADALAVPDIHIHLYGKTRVAAGRKMGHITALGETQDGARARAERGAALLGFAEE